MGATVYRVKDDRIEAGTVHTVARCNDVDRPVAVADGRFPHYSARFGSEWVSQTYSWRFFGRREEAVARLTARLERDVEDIDRHAATLRARIARIQSGEETP